MPKRQWPDNVPQTEGHEYDSIHGHFLRVASVVGGDPGIQERKTGANTIGEVVADKLTSFVLAR